MSTAFSTLYAYAQRRMHNRADANSVIIAKEVANRALRRIAERDHPHFRKQGYIPLVAAYSSGTVAIDNGGTLVSGTNATWSSAFTGRYMKIGDEPVPFKLITYVSGVSGPSFALDGGAKWLNTAVTSSTYTIYKDTYDFPSDYRTMGKFVESSLLTDVDWLDSEDEWHLNKMRNFGMTGPPRWACLENDKLRLWPYATDLTNLTFIYYFWPTDMVADDDLMDFPDAQIDLVRAAIRAEVAIERGKDETEMESAYAKKERAVHIAAAHPQASFSVGSAAPEVAPQTYIIGDDVE